MTRPTCSGNAYEDCDAPAEFIRHTQFAGSHPFCRKHAEQEEDFHEESSYLDWETLNTE